MSKLNITVNQLINEHILQVVKRGPTFVCHILGGGLELFD